MKDFISLAACKGTSPVRTLGKIISRPHLTNRLMQQRQRPRLVCGPTGFGKTSLLLDYADTMFGFQHTFWLDAGSPCFVRDLDAGDFAARIFEVDEAAACVVLEDVPALDEVRLQRLGNLADTLGAKGCELLMTATPVAAKALEGLFGLADVDSEHLLLTDAEWSGYLAGAHRDETGDIRERMQRIPGMSWGRASGYDCERAALGDLAGEGLPREAGALLTCLVLWQRGTLDEVSESLHAGTPELYAAGGDGGSETSDGPFATRNLRDLLAAWPLVWLDEDSGAFCTLPCSPKGIVRALRSRLDDAAAVWGFTDATQVLATTATWLLASGDGERAAAIAQALPRSGDRAAWLAAHQVQLMDDGWLLEACALFEAVGTALAKNPHVWRLRSGQALRLHALGFNDAARGLVREMLLSAGTPAEERLLACLTQVWAAAPERRARALVQLAEVLETWDCEHQSSPSAGIAELARFVLEAGRHEGGDVEQSLRGHRRWRQAVARRTGEEQRISSVCAIYGAYLLCRELKPAAADGGEETRRELLDLREWVLWQLRDRRETMYTAASRLSAPASWLMECLQLLQDAGLPPVSLPSAVIAAYRRTTEHLARQQRAARTRFGFNGSDNGTGIASPAATALPAASSRGKGGGIAADTPPNTPLLYVRLFGALEVRIGDRQVPVREFSRQKVKVLMALLTLNAGRELSRGQLVAELWPSSYADVAARSFYSIWSRLRHALADQSGECPYLQRMQHGFRLDGRLVRSDVARIEEICRVFLLGRVDGQRWLELLEEFEDLYRGDLLPSEDESQAIRTARTQCQRRAIDALLEASSRLLEEGEERVALLFAYAAYTREAQREDVYWMLMRAQVACDQRTSAVDTFLACKQMLSEGLGLDPSKKMLDLYVSIINDEESGFRMAM